MVSGRKHIEGLHTLLTQAEIDFEMWLAMRHARREQAFATLVNRRYGRFYFAAENALFNSVILILYMAFETHGKTTNFSALKSSLANELSSGRAIFHPDPFLDFDEDSDQMHEDTSLRSDVLAQVEARLNEISEGTWRKVMLIRNNIVGHQASGQDSEAIYRRAALDIDQVRRMITDAQTLLKEIALKFYAVEIDFNLKGTTTFDALASDLMAHKASLAP